MRPQGFGQVGAGLEDLGWNDMGFEPPKPAQNVEADAEHDAFGEVIPAHPHNLAGLTPVESPVHNQQAEIAGRLSAYSPDEADEEEIDETAELYDPDGELEEIEEVDEAPAAVVVAPAPAPVAKPQPAPVVRRQRTPRAAPGSKGKAAFTLRLDPDRHLKLRLACAVDGRSAQMLVTQALDRLLDEIPDLDTLAQKAKRKG
jgi:DNA segregation ATPase FtsK/SpoIIIE-like protein